MRFALIRFLRAVAVLFALSLLAYGLVRLIPGDPVSLVAGPNSDPAVRQALAAKLGLDRPWWQQYGVWLEHAVRGDFGNSVLSGTSVGQQVSQRLPVTVELAVYATFLSLLWGIPLGILAARKQGRVWDYLVRGTMFAGLATPSFVLGTVLILILSVKVSAWPLFSFVSFTQDPVQNLQVMLLPAFSLGLPLGAAVCRYMRASLLDTYQENWIKTVRAKGATEPRILWRHAFRNSSVPVLTIVGLQLAFLVGGTITVEVVFALPGLGSLVVSSITQHDYPVVQACVLVIGAVYVFLNFIVDALYTVIDPRVRRREESS